MKTLMQNLNEIVGTVVVSYFVRIIRIWQSLRPIDVSIRMLMSQSEDVVRIYSSVF